VNALFAALRHILGGAVALDHSAAQGLPGIRAGYLVIRLFLRSGIMLITIVGCHSCFLLSKQPLKWKLAGIIMPFLLIIPFVIHTRNEAYKLTVRGSSPLHRLAAGQ